MLTNYFFRQSSHRCDPRSRPMSVSRSNPLVALSMLLVLAGCEANTAPSVNSERPVQVQRVSFDNENVSREFVGVVRARYETDLAFRVGGKIVARLVNVAALGEAGANVAGAT